MILFKRLCTHGLLLFFVGLFFLPLYLAFVAASNEGQALLQGMPMLPGGLFFHNLSIVLMHGMEAAGGVPVWQMLISSFVMAVLIAGGKILVALLSAFALVYFTLPGKKIIFALIFSTMMLPIEVRIVPTFQVIANLGWLNQYSGLTLPLMASATATFLFRQFFKSLPAELCEAAKMDGAGPWRFFFDILLPVAKTPIASLFIILFVYGWNQYLWPLVATTDNDLATIVMGIRYMAGVADQVPQWHYIMCTALLAMFPPCLIVLLLQRWFEKGLTH